MEDPGGHSIYLLGGFSPEVEGLHSVSTPACLRCGGKSGSGAGKQQRLDRMEMVLVESREGAVDTDSLALLGA